MIMTENKINNFFQEFYDAQTDNRKKEILNIVMKKIDCSISAFYYKKRKNCFTLLEKQAISGVLKIVFK